MLIIRPRDPNERHREFRKRHPGYHARIQARKRQSAKHDAAILEAQQKARLAAQASGELPDSSGQLLFPFATQR